MRVLSQRIASQRVLLQASDEMNVAQRALWSASASPEEIAPSQIKPRNLAAIKSGASGRNGLKGRAAGTSNAARLNAEITRLKGELSRVRREKRMTGTGSWRTKRQSASREEKRLKTRAALESLRRELRETQAEMSSLRKAGSADGQALRRARDTIKQLEGNVEQERQRAAFLRSRLRRKGRGQSWE